MDILPVEDNSTDRLLTIETLEDSASNGTTHALEKTQGDTTILVVEDDPTIREMATMYLERDGYHVMEAHDGAQAVLLWEKHEGKIDLILTDVMIPGGLNGHQLVERLQADRPDLKAIFVSGYSSGRLGRGTFDETTNFLQKPYRLKNLSEMVHNCLGRSEAA